jgi:amino acid permease
VLQGPLRSEGGPGSTLVLELEKRSAPFSYAAAVGITCFFYCLVGVFGYLAFPATVHSNILTNFPQGDPLMQAIAGERVSQKLMTFL